MKHHCEAQAGEPPAQVPTADATHGCSLANLPLEVIEAICKPVLLRDRVSLISCCRALWARPDIAASAALWGDLDLTRHRLQPARKQASLAAWLGRRCAAARCLHLAGRMEGLAVVLASLAGSRLASLGVFDNAACGEGTLAALRPLCQLPALTQLQLSNCGLQSLPQELTALSLLAALDVSGNSSYTLSLGQGGSAAFRVRRYNYAMVGGGGRAFAPLQGLAALTRLDLRDCSLKSLPPQLSALTGLAELGLRYNYSLGPGAGQAGFQALWHLVALTYLDVSRCGLARLPQELTTLLRLAVLDLDDNEFLGGGGGGGAFEPLCHLAALRTLHLGCCGLHSLPVQLADLRGLADLRMWGNHALGTAGPGAFLALQHCTALTSLDVRRCGLASVPHQLSALHSLLELRLNANQRLGTGVEVSFQALQHLTTVTLLEMEACSLRRLPPQISSLAALAHLHLSENVSLGKGGGGRLGGLQQLAALTRLGAAGCGLECMPVQLQALTRLAVLGLAHNAQLGPVGDAAFQPLQALTALEQLDLEGCNLQRLPSQLSGLTRLELLSLSMNAALGEGAPGTFQLLSKLTSLTSLNLGCCRLEGVPPQVSALRGLAVLHLSQNPSLFGAGRQAAFRPLQGLTALSRLRLVGSKLERLPPQLAALGVPVEYC